MSPLNWWDSKGKRHVANGFTMRELEDMHTKTSERSTPASEAQPSYDMGERENAGLIVERAPTDVTDARLAESARFAAGGYTVTTVEEACTEMDRLSAGWRAEAVARLAAQAEAERLRTALTDRLTQCRRDADHYFDAGRTGTPVRSDEEAHTTLFGNAATYDQIMASVLILLTHNGIAAWNGDGTSIIAQAFVKLFEYQSWLRASLDAAKKEAEESEACTEAVLAKLAEVARLRATLDVREAERDAARAMLLDCSGMLRDRLTHDAMDRERLDAILARQNAWLPTLDEIRGILAEPDAALPSRASASLTEEREP